MSSEGGRATVGDSSERIMNPAVVGTPLSAPFHMLASCKLYLCELGTHTSREQDRVQQPLVTTQRCIPVITPTQRAQACLG